MEDAFPCDGGESIQELRVISARKSSASQESVTLFASPLMLATLGPYLLRPDPADLFEKGLAAHDFVGMDEAKRLIECMGFYYVLLLRDIGNKV